MKLTIADYGIGNLGSVVRGFAHCGAEILLAKDADAVRHAERLVVPGVGAFGDVVARVRQSGLEEAIRLFVETGRPLLGICVGMQMMMETSEEFGRHEGLGLFRGAVRAIPYIGADGVPHKVPHIGWASLQMPEARSWRGTLLERTSSEDSFYFVHSFTASPISDDDRLADVSYDGCRIAAVIARDNIYGCQFHPEKSGPAGLKILETFLSL